MRRPHKPHGLRMRLLAVRRAFVLVVFVLCATSNRLRANDVIFDIVPQLAPTNAEKIVPFFRSQGFEAGTGCTLTYRRTENSVQASWQVLEDTGAIRSAFRNLRTQVTTWWADPALCSPEAKVTVGPDWVQVSVPGPQQTAQAITFMQDRIVMRQRSIEGFAKHFGAPFFRSENRRQIGNKHHEYVVARFDRPVSLGDYRKLRLIVDAKLAHAEINTGCVPGKPPPGAQNCYEPRGMATQFRAAFGNITWTDPRCKVADPADPVCQGRFMQASISLFDERRHFHNNDFFVQRGNFRDDRARIPIYRIDLRQLLPSGAVTNPFRTIGNRTTAEADVLPLLKKGLLLGEQSGYLPPRLVKAGGAKETDDEYISHYSFASMNIGFEVSGLSDISFEIDRFSLVGLR